MIAGIEPRTRRADGGAGIGGRERSHKSVMVAGVVLAQRPQRVSGGHGSAVGTPAVDEHLLALDGHATVPAPPVVPFPVDPDLRAGKRPPAAVVVVGMRASSSTQIERSVGRREGWHAPQAARALERRQAVRSTLAGSNPAGASQGLRLLATGA